MSVSRALADQSNKNKRTKTTDNRKEIRKLALYYLDELKKIRPSNKPPPPRVYHRGIATTGFQKYDKLNVTGIKTKV